MAQINLLPWRESQRNEDKRLYLTILMGIAIIALGFMFGVGSIVDNMIIHQERRNQLLERELVVLDEQIEKIKNIKKDKQALEQRMGLIEQLETSRNAVPHILDELVRLVPPGLSFKSFSRKGNRIEILGISKANSRLADFMRRLDQSSVFSGGILSSIIADTSALEAVSDFKLTFTINPNVAPDFANEAMGTKK